MSGYREVAQDSDSDYNAPEHAAPTPHSDSLEAVPTLAGMERLVAELVDKADRHDKIGIAMAKVVGGFRALLSRLETLTRKAATWEKSSEEWRAKEMKTAAENARMVEVVEAVRAQIRRKAELGQSSGLDEAVLVALRASRTQSPDANREENAKP